MRDLATADLDGRGVVCKEVDIAMTDEPHAPAHPMRRVVRWVVIAVLTACLARALLLLAGV